MQSRLIESIIQSKVLVELNLGKVGEVLSKRQAKYIILSGAFEKIRNSIICLKCSRLKLIILPSSEMRNKDLRNQSQEKDYKGLKTRKYAK